MNGYLVSSFLLLSMVIIFVAIFVKSSKKSDLFLSLSVIILFILCVITRQYGYSDDNDIGYYIERFQDNNRSYFGVAYMVLLNLIRLFGTSSTVYLTFISLIIIICAYVSIKIIDKDEAIVENALGCNIAIQHKSFKALFLIFFIAYWGFAYATEVVRTGLAISFSMISIAIVLKNEKDKKDYFIFCVTYLISLLFHWSQIVLLPFFLYVLLKKKPVSQKIFYAILIFKLVYDITNINKILSPFILSVVENILSLFGDRFNHYFIYFNRINNDSLFSLQHIFYFLCGVFFTTLNINNRKYNNCLMGYIYGLLIASFFSFFEVVMRIQWPLLMLNSYLFYFYVTDRSSKGFLHSNSIKTLASITFVLSYSMMYYRWLGLRF